VLKQGVTTKDYDMSLLGARLQIFTGLGSKYVQVLSYPRACNGATYTLGVHAVLMEAGH
jgi:hypothetical protein